MAQSRITQQDESSMTLNDHTVIQIYDNLDYSDQIKDYSSSNEHSLSQSHLIQLNQMHQIQEIKDSFHHQFHHPPRPNPTPRSRPSNRPFRDIEAKYDFGISPSTKEEQSLLKYNEQHPRKNFPIHINQGPNLPRIQPNGYQQNGYYASEEDEQEEIIEEESADSGRGAKLGVMKKDPHFNINSFLNAHPVAFKNKKGIQLFKEIKEKSPKASKKNQKYNLPPKGPIYEENTITLITLPQINNQSSQQLKAAYKKSERELEEINLGWQRRFREAKLGFIDSFMPQSLKIKKNPYNLLKYLNNRIRI